MSKQHRTNEVIQLTEVQHVLRKPGMYIGDSSRSSHTKWHMNDVGEMINSKLNISPGLLKLFDEIISNSIDEALRTNFEYANKIDVLVDGNTVTVKDNGRGIPVKKSKGESITQAEMAFTSLRAGANFGDEAVVSIGTHGLGSTLVNIMSTVFRAETCDGKNKLTLICTKNLSSTKSKITKCKVNGTLVEYTPDFEHFDGCTGLTKDDMKMIEKRLMDLTVCFPDIIFTLNKRKVRHGSSSMGFRRYANLYSPDAICVEDKNYRVAIFPVDEPTNISFVNGIDTYNGGTHVDVVSHFIVEQLLLNFKKKYKKLDIKPGDIKNHLGFIIFTNSIKGAKFDSQTKTKITNKWTDIRPVFESLDAQDSFFKKILKCPELTDPIIETKKLKLEAKERAALNRAQKNVKKIKVAAHIPANSKDPRKRILFLSEGASASGQLLSVRDPMIHGSYPLRGKVMNISGKKSSVVVQNKELCNLMAILGISIGQKAIDMNYGKIGLLMDADTDGNSIAGLLFNFFAQWPEIFHEQKIVLVKTPIMLARKGKITKRFYSLTEYEKASSSLKGYELTYIKGLGSLPLDEYKRIINEPIFIPIQFDKDARAKLDMAFGNDSNLRKEWLS